MKKIISKKQVIEAIMTEPNLHSGRFFDTDFQSNQSCKVCAVGAVLRKVSFEKWMRKNKIGTGVNLIAETFGLDESGFDKFESLSKALKSKHYLSALSIKFEKTLSKLGNFVPVQDKHRKLICKWVDKNFPKWFTVNAKKYDLI